VHNVMTECISKSSIQDGWSTIRSRQHASMAAGATTGPAAALPPGQELRWQLRFLGMAVLAPLAAVGRISRHRGLPTEPALLAKVCSVVAPVIPIPENF